MIIILIFAAAVGSRLGFHSYTGFLLDDAFITFRYAANIAAGHGFVYNIGEHVLGTTTPLFTLILAACTRLGLPMVGSAITISVLCAGVTAVLIYRIAGLWDFGRFAAIPVALVILYPRLLAMDTAGMETALFTLLITATLYLRMRGRISAAVGMAALATLTRPEGLLLLGLVIVADARVERRRILQHVMLASGIILPWVIFAWAYFGSPIPNSVWAKLALYSRFGTKSPMGNLSFIFALHRLLGIASFILGLIGTWYLLRTRRTGGFEFLWAGAMVCALSFSRTHLFMWYFSPIYVIYLLAVGATAPMVLGDKRWFSRLPGRGHALLLLTVVTALLVVNVKFAQTHSAAQHANQATFASAGYYLRDHAEADDVVAAEDIGYMGYYSNLYFIDRDGLMTPGAASYNRRGDYLGLIRDNSPDWVVAVPKGYMSDFVEHHWFIANYELARDFQADSGPAYNLYHRKTD